MLTLRRPTELQDHLAYITAYAPDTYPPEDETTNATAFAVAFTALALFSLHTPSPTGREVVAQCLRQLRLVYELYEHGDSATAERLLLDTRDDFLRARKFIALSDE
jgi:hypothetical protein